MMDIWLFSVKSSARVFTPAKYQSKLHSLRFMIDVINESLCDFT
jgi:hypothetical protein